ncbi:MAG: lysophospholipid acyltransferase family protein [Tepidisphaeraceae bacterium]
MPDLADAPLARLARFPREPDILCYGSRFAAALAMRAALRAYHRFDIHGRENLPVDGRSYVLVANHSSHLDGLCLLSAVPLRRIHRAYPAAARDYFFRSPASTALAATFINALPFDRAGNVRHSMAVCRELLQRDGNVLILFPEGTRSTNGHVGPFRRGVGDLVAGTDVPVVPCYLDGAGAAWPKGAWLPRPRRVRLVIGTPRAYGYVAPSKGSSRAIGEDLRRAVLALAPTIHLDPDGSQMSGSKGGLYDGDRSPSGRQTGAAA